MRKWISFFLLVLMVALPSAAAAQGTPQIAILEVKLWPEFDQPTMLVIYDFTLTEDTPLPASLTFKLPIGVSLNAVAVLENGVLNTIDYKGPVPTAEWQEVTLVVDQRTSYHFEYYAPILKSDSQRRYNFEWLGEYAVDDLRISVQQPPSATAFKGSPALTASQDTDNLTYHRLETTGLKQGEPFELIVEYKKDNESLTAPDSAIQPSDPLDENTTGRISLTNYIPYLIGGVGIVLIASAVGYYYLFARRNSDNRSVRRRRIRAAAPGEDAAKIIYCSQCGERARPGDRFCRVCGTRLRHE